MSVLDTFSRWQICEVNETSAAIRYVYVLDGKVVSPEVWWHTGIVEMAKVMGLLKANESESTDDDTR